MIRQRVAASLAGRRRTTSGNPPPPPEPANCSFVDEGGGGESESFSSEEEEGGKKPWQRVDQSVYEEQLEKLQEQLVQVMLENQALQGILYVRKNFTGRLIRTLTCAHSSAAELEEQRKKPGSSQRRELEQLRQENTALQQSLRHQATSSTSSQPSATRCAMTTYSQLCRVFY